MQLSRKKNIRITFILLLLLQCIGCLPVFAGDGPTMPLLGSKGAVVLNATSTVAVPASTVAVEQTYAIQNMVSVGIEEGTTNYIQSDHFDVTVTLDITTYDAQGDITSKLTKDFPVSYSKADGAKYNATVYYPFKNAYKVTVKIAAISPDPKTATWDFSKVLRVDNSINVIRDYAFACTQRVTGLTTSLDVTNQELTAKWDPTKFGQTQYDLEWAWVDASAMQQYGTLSDIDSNLIFENNASRVTVSADKNTYNIPLLYDGDGFLFVRVRPSQLKHNGQLVEGIWTWQTLTPGEQRPITSPSAPMVSYSYAGHQNNLNWQASTSFAEEGKRKSVVQYFDGSLRSRQTVTKDNTTNTTIVAESFYDYQGRPVIQVLPSPTLSNIIQYSQNFNQSIDYITTPGYPKSEYDKLAPNTSTCGNPAAPLSTVSGASNYYSPNNPLVQNPPPGYNPSNFVPTSEGPTSGQAFPFTETRFAQDGRLSAQSGVGYMHQIGSDHETKYYYESAPQEELDALFGTDAGQASHYFKNIVRDANGQYSVSYTDMHGRTIATALAGEAPTQLDQLASYKPVNFTQGLLDNETNNVDGTSIISTKSIMVEKAEPYNFNYTLNPQQLSLLTCNGTVCFDCLYNLKITVTSDCNETQGFPVVLTDSNFTLGQNLNAPANCNNGFTTGTFNRSFTVNFPTEGLYTVTKVLSLSDSAKSAYRNVFIQDDTCKTFQNFYDSALNLLTTESNCNITCATCIAAIGNSVTDFINNYINQTKTPLPSGWTTPLTFLQENQLFPATTITTLTASYNEALTNCNALCNGNNDDGLDEVRSIEQAMLLDMTPPNGQYANPDSSTKFFNIFNTNPPFPNYNLLYPALSKRASYLYPIEYVQGATTYPTGHYYDDNGFIDDPIPLPANSPVSPQKGFSDQFVSSWAMELLPYHPEFCKLKTSLEILPATYKYEATLTNDTTFSQAMPYLSVTNGAIDILNKDPFFQTVGVGFRDSMLTKMTIYAPATSFPPDESSCGIAPFNASMWQIAQSSVMTQNEVGDPCAQLTTMFHTPANPPTDTVDCTPDWNMAWMMFKSMYLSQRRRYISEYLNATCVPELKVVPIDPQHPNITTHVHDYSDEIILTPSYYYQQRFTDFSNPSLSNLGVATDESSFLQSFTSNPPGTAASITAAAQALESGQADSTCAGYIPTWIAELEQCPGIGTINSTDSTWIVNNLMSICTKGSDANHIFGSSTLPPGATGPYSSFSAVIAAYLQQKQIPISALCYPQLITQPSPYGAQQALINEPIVTRPDTCECKRINSLLSKFQQSKDTGTFVEYLANKYGTIISEGAIDSLMDLCNKPKTCNFLSVPILLPPVLQCDGTDTTTKVCLACIDMQNLEDSFYTEFKQHAPIINPATANDTILNNAFQRYANNKTGFTKNWSDYTAFLDTCNKTPGAYGVTTGGTGTSATTGTGGTVESGGTTGSGGTTTGTGGTSGTVTPPSPVSTFAADTISACGCLKTLTDYLLSSHNLFITQSQNITVAQLVSMANSAGYTLSVTDCSILSDNRNGLFYTLNTGTSGSAYRAKVGNCTIALNRSDADTSSFYNLASQTCSGNSSVSFYDNTPTATISTKTDTISKTFYATSSLINNFYSGPSGLYEVPDTTSDRIVTLSNPPGEPYSSRSLVKFDGLSIPTGATLLSATMNLFADPNGYNSPSLPNAHSGLLNGGADTTILELGIPNFNWTTSSSAADITTGFSQGFSSGTYFNITSPFQDLTGINCMGYVSTWLSPAGNDGFVTYTYSTNHVAPPNPAYTTFCSNKYPDASKRPTLNISYSLPPGADTTYALNSSTIATLSVVSCDVDGSVNAIDTCNCKRYAQVYNNAIAAGYNGSSLSSLNQYFKATYGDTLTQVLYNGLQHCSGLMQITPPHTVQDTVTKVFTTSTSVILNTMLLGAPNPTAPTVDTISDKLTATEAYESLSYYSLIKFDSISTIPATATVLLSALNLYADPQGFDPPRITNANGILVPNSGPSNSFVEGVNFFLPAFQWGVDSSTAFWANTTVPLANSIYSPNFVSNYQIGAPFQDISTNVSTAVTQWLTNPLGNTGLLVTTSAPPSGDTSFATFASNKYPDVTKRPTLTVTYAYSVTVPGDTTYTYPLGQQAPLPSFLECSYTAPPFNCTQANQILQQYKQLFVSPSDGSVDISMRTFAGNKTPDEGPKGVFDVNKILIGNTFDGTLTQIDTSYARIWNSSPADQAIGTLSYPSPAGGGVFRLTLKPGQQAPCDGIIGMRYYQFDMYKNDEPNPSNIYDSNQPDLYVGQSCYVDFGDGNRINVDSSYNANMNQNPSPATPGTSVQGGTDVVGVTGLLADHTGGGFMFSSRSILHNYADSNLKTVTVYHPDIQGLFKFQDSYAYNHQAPNLSNLRGYMPQQTFDFWFYATYDSVFNTKNIINFNEINSIGNVFTATTPDYNETNNLPSNDFSSFANNHTIKSITLATHPRTTTPCNCLAAEYQKFTKFFPNVNSNFKNLIEVNIVSNLGNPSMATDPSTIPFDSISSLGFFTFNDNISPTYLDSIIIKIARSAKDSGIILVAAGGNGSIPTVRTSLSDAAYNSLISRHWYITGVNAVENLATDPNKDASFTPPPMLDTGILTNAFTDYYNQQAGTNYSFPQLQSTYQKNCGALDICTPLPPPPFDCTSAGQILNNYDSLYVMPKTGYVDLSMRTFAGNKTPDEGPKGVFDANKNLIGNTADGTLTQVDTSFARIWNSSSVDQAIGTLSYPSPAGSGLFRLTLNAGQPAPCNGIIGMRYYQVDVEGSNLDQLKVGPSCYIDFGDTVQINIDSAMGANSLINVHNSTLIKSPFILGQYSVNVGYNKKSLVLNQAYIIEHNYVSPANRTVTVYHPDVDGVFGFLDLYSNGVNFPLTNLRGYMPQQTLDFVFDYTSDSLLNTQRIVNFNQVNSILSVEMYQNKEDNKPTNYFSSFINNNGLRYILYFPSPQTNALVERFNSFFPDLKDNFKKLTGLESNMSNLQATGASSIDFSLPSIAFLELDGVIPTSALIDSIYIQVARSSADSGLIEGGGFFNSAPPRTSLSDAAYNSLTSRGWQLPNNSNHLSPLTIDTVLLQDSTPLTSAFTDYYNQQKNTTYSYHQLLALYQGCGKSLNFCVAASVVIPNDNGPWLCGLNEPISQPLSATDATPSNPLCQNIAEYAYTSAMEKWQLYQDSVRNVFDTAYTNKCMQAKNYESFTVNYKTNQYGYTLYYYDQAGNLTRTVPPVGVDVSKFGWADSYRDSVELQKANNGAPLVPAHYMATDYRYNTLNQVIAQQTPDAGESQFWYDALGRLVVSQNAKQADPTQVGGPRYSYTIYDGLGRIIEVGQKPSTTSMSQSISTNQTTLTNWLSTGSAKEQITRTLYDIPYLAGNGAPLYQSNLRNRVSTTTYYNLSTDIHPASATYYSYDIEGNVDTLIQDNGSGGIMDQTNNRYKKIVYNYDLISGKVNQVSYQTGMADQFYHRYEYDAENRITCVYTSHDSLIWEKDARYAYYKHGPLARTIIGQQQVQGIDYAYTLQGWLKGVNSITGIGSNPCPDNNDNVQDLKVYNRSDFGMPTVYKATTEIDFEPDNTFTSNSPTDNFSTLIDPNPVPCTNTGLPSGSPMPDMGGDGIAGSPNANIGQDAYSYNLNYFGGDYQPADVPHPNYYIQAAELPLSITGRDLYNGNISSMAVNIPKLGNPMLYGYRYDQLNRITEMDAFTGLNTATNLWTPLSTQDYQERVGYDPNGNIISYKRNGAQAAGGLPMDSLHYFYNYYKADNVTIGTYISSDPIAAGTTRRTNQLNYVRDAAADGNYTADIKNEPVNNYAYDAIGNLIKDCKAGIQSITWTVYGKIDSINEIDSKGVTTRIKYKYNPEGDRISKTVYKGANIVSTFYVDDARGNVISVYTINPSLNTGQITQVEADLYSTIRLGIFNLNRNVNNLQSANYLNTINTFVRGEKNFQLTNHLGSVLLTISDKIIQHSADNTTVDYSIADVVTANDYYPYGMEMPGRKYEQLNGLYRYGFNGQEKSTEINPNSNTAMFWEYDTRIGRRWNIDPKQKIEESSYLCFSGNPIMFSDLLGDEADDKGVKLKNGQKRAWKDKNGIQHTQKWDGKKWNDNDILKEVVVHNTTHHKNPIPKPIYSVPSKIDLILTAAGESNSAAAAILEKQNENLRNLAESATSTAVDDEIEANEKILGRLEQADIFFSAIDIGKGMYKLSNNGDFWEGLPVVGGVFGAAWDALKTRDNDMIWSMIDKGNVGVQLFLQGQNNESGMVGIFVHTDVLKRIIAQGYLDMSINPHSPLPNEQLQNKDYTDHATGEKLQYYIIFPKSHTGSHITNMLIMKVQ